MRYFIGKCFLLIALIYPVIIYSQINCKTDKTDNKQTPSDYINKIFNSYDTSYIKKVSTDFVIIIKSLNWMDTYQLSKTDINLNLKSDLCYNLGLSAG